MPGSTETGPTYKDSASPKNLASPPTIQLWSGREVRLLREAMRMSLRDFAAHLGVSERVVSKWEAGVDKLHPRPVNQQLLDTALARAGTSVQLRFQQFASQAETQSEQLDGAPLVGTSGQLVVRSSRVASTPHSINSPASLAASVSRRIALGASIDPVTPAGEALLDAAESVRRDVEDTLASGTISPTRLNRLEELVANHIRVYTTTAPAYALANLLVDFSDVRRLAAQRQPAMMQARLSEISALLATLAADSLMKLGQIRSAHAWYGTAQVAADDSVNNELRARVRAQHAMLPYYYGQPSEAVRLARDAQAILGDTPHAAGALAAATEARALARLGSEPEARRALLLAQELVGKISVPGNSETDDAFVFGTRRFLFYASGTMTNLGDIDAARSFQEQALAHYGDKEGLIDPALVRLDQVYLLAVNGDLREVGTLALEAVNSVPAPQRTLIFAARLGQIASVIPREHEVFRIIKRILSQLADPDTEGI